MARKRAIQAHKGLPQGWQIRCGRYIYRVPKGQEANWDNKTEFRLGKSLSEAYITYAGRITSFDGGIRTFSQLFDRYLLDVLPEKAKATQRTQRPVLQQLREMIGSNHVSHFKPVDAYRLRDHIQTTAQASARKAGKVKANRYMGLLKHTLTKAIEWGVIEAHPMTDGKFMNIPEGRSSLRVPTIDDIMDALELTENPTLKGFTQFQALTGFRSTDTLNIKFSDIKDGKLTVTLNKTRNSTGQINVFDINEDLAKIISECRAIKPLSPYLFHTNRGKSYLNEDNIHSGFNSLWALWMNKVPEEKRFAIRTLRNFNGHQGDLVTASERLGHSSTKTTKSRYRPNITNVVPLTAQKIL